MMSRANGVQLSLFTTTLDEVVPSDHFLRKLDVAVDFSFIYEELASYYCKDNGRPSTDPVVIVKSLLIGFLYGINSERRLEQELRYNVAYRWFLGLGFDESIPDHSTQYHSYAAESLMMLICSKSSFCLPCLFAILQSYTFLQSKQC